MAPTPVTGAKTPASGLVRKTHYNRHGKALRKMYKRRKMEVKKCLTKLKHAKKKVTAMKKRLGKARKAVKSVGKKTRRRRRK